MSENRVNSLQKVLSKNLVIPTYQRPYEWNKSNVYILLDDIYNSYNKNNNKIINLGTIILNKNPKGEDEVVDGQQRLITLSLLLTTIKNEFNIEDNKFNNRLLDKEILCISNTEERIISNNNSIKEFINGLVKYENINIKNYYNFLKEKINFYVLETKNSNEAFQLFDGRNSKYKNLTPVDLLKAYHLGELPINYPTKQKRRLLINWNDNIKDSFDIDNSCNKVEYLYNNILFNIYNWSLNKEIKSFTKNDIYLYKGFKGDIMYSYVKYYKQSNLFQMNKPFKSGEKFFKMTNHYIKKLDKIIKENNLIVRSKTNLNNYSENLKYINYLYYGALLTFYDKFGDDIKDFYRKAIEDFIYRYSILLRTKNELVGIQQLNNYVLNTKNNFFFECNKALKVEELLKLELEDIGNSPDEKEKLWEMRTGLWNELK